MNKTLSRLWFCCGFLVIAAPLNAENPTYDIVVYGGTSGGIIAGIQAGAMGKSVVVIEPSGHIGGLTTGGLGRTDIGNKQVIGGLSRDFYIRIAKHYAKPSSWNWQKEDAYVTKGQTSTDAGEDAMWTFEPSAATTVYQEWISETGLEVITGQRLNRESGVKKDGARIISITMKSGRTFSGRMFIDATYEGDLMAAAGVSYTVGREAGSQYGESLNGVRTKLAKEHNLVAAVDPYIEPGNPASGLLRFIDPDGPGTEGGGDKRVQAYNFRMCLTDHPENRIPFHKPDGYDESWFELLFRNYEAGYSGIPWINSPMPNRKTDTNNRDGVSTDFIGGNYDYPEASDAGREAIVARHLLYQQGLMWTLANHPRIPASVRKEVSRWGMAKDEFIEGNGWQSQIYVREARRLVSEYVMTQHHCKGHETATDPVGMGAYQMDSHNVQRHVDANGHARNEGDVEVGGFPPYPLSYRAIRPKKEECENLFVPFCLSASHIAFGSIRMEPVFMVLGQSSATAASIAIDDGVAVQDVNYEKLRKRLIADGQILENAAKAGKHMVDPAKLKGVVVDDSEAEVEGPWQHSKLPSGILFGCRHDGGASDGKCVAVFRTKLPQSGRYEVQVAYASHSNRASNVPVEIETSDGNKKVVLNQRQEPKIERLFTAVGTFSFGSEAVVRMSNANTNGHVIIDAVRFIATD